LGAGLEMWDVRKERSKEHGLERWVCRGTVRVTRAWS